MGEMAQLIVTGFGPSATQALRRLVSDAKKGDPLTPVDVVVPSGVSSVTVRRELADPGLVNVRFSSLPQLATRLAARYMALNGIDPLTTQARTLAVRKAIRQCSGRLAEAAANPSTASLLEGLAVELDGAEAFVDDRLNFLVTASGRGREVAEMYGKYRGEVAGLATAPEVLDAAAAAVAASEAPDTHVIVLAPCRLTAAERRLLECLADRRRLACVLTLTGDAAADEDARALETWIVPILGPADHADLPPYPSTILELAPDAEEEVRLAVRRILAYLESNPVRPERIAIAYRSSVPYVRLLDEQLTTSGLPFHVTGARRLAESVAGHAMLQLLDLRPSDYARAEVLDWLSDAPILDADGHNIPAARWDRLSREAGVNRSHQVWRDRLDRHAASILDRRSKVEGDDLSADARRDSYDRRVADCQALAAFVDEVVAGCHAVAAATTWLDASRALHAAMERFLGTSRQADRWGQDGTETRWVDVERDAYDAVIAAVDALPALDGIDNTPPTYEAARQALASGLDQPLPSGTTLGRGLTVAPIRDLVGADLDLLVVLGMTEEAFPPRLREHPILRDAEREAVGSLATVADRRRTDRRDYLAAAAAARTLVLSSPRADTRGQRALHPSPWFMETAARLNDGRPLASGDLHELSDTMLHQHESFAAALIGTSTPASMSEFDIQLAMTGHGDSLGRDAPRYTRGRQAVAARRDGAFGEWTGYVGDLDESLRARVDQRLSATSLQTYAACPLRFWLNRVLEVRELDDPGEDDTIDAGTKGSLVHDVLERFFRDSLPVGKAPGRSPDAKWSSDETAHAHKLLDLAAAELEATGRTGRPLLWRAQKARLHRQLARMLIVDSTLRAQRRSRPIALEDPFGRLDQSPLTLELARSGKVDLAGFIDRIDRTDDGRLLVTDYKTGKGGGYDRIPRIDGKAPAEPDLLDRGRKLQLVLYALAARERHGVPDTPVESYYWFVERGSEHRGAPIGAEAEHRLLDVLDVSVNGIRTGIYPAHPGEDTYFGWESCGFCPYDRVCPAARGEQWESTRADPAVQPYADLVSLPPSTDEEAGA
jgi:RecB family exonuclease